MIRLCSLLSAAGLCAALQAHADFITPLSSFTQLTGLNRTPLRDLTYSQSDSNNFLSPLEAHLHSQQTNGYTAKLDATAGTQTTPGGDLMRLSATGYCSWYMSGVIGEVMQVSVTQHFVFQVNYAAPGLIRLAVGPLPIGHTAYSATGFFKRDGVSLCEGTDVQELIYSSEVGETILPGVYEYSLSYTTECVGTATLGETFAGGATAELTLFNMDTPTPGVLPVFCLAGLTGLARRRGLWLDRRGPASPHSAENR